MPDGTAQEHWLTPLSYFPVEPRNNLGSVYGYLPNRSLGNPGEVSREA